MEEHSWPKGRGSAEAPGTRELSTSGTRERAALITIRRMETRGDGCPVAEIHLRRAMAKRYRMRSTTGHERLEHETAHAGGRRA